MKRSTVLLSLLFLLLLSACQPVARPESPSEPEMAVAATPDPAAAPAPAVGPGAVAAPAAEQAITEDESYYRDPEGRFSVPIPINWTTEMADDYLLLASPEGGIQVYIVTIQDEDLEAAVDEAWAQVDPDFALEPDAVINIPVTGGIEAGLVVEYDTDIATEGIYAAIAQLYEGTAYILLIQGELVAIQQRAAQLGIVQSGFTIAGVEEIDLAGVQPLPLTDELLAELEEYIEDAMSRFNIPGAAVAIVQDGEIAYTSGFGVRALDGDEPITPETLMMIGSTGKTLTTLLMATLVDEGFMTWDTPVQAVLPEFAVADPELSASITIRNLVCACTGVPRRDLEFLFNADELTAEGIIESLQTFEFFTEFGEAFQYSNQLVATGGYAAAAAAGGDYGDLFDRYVQELEERVLDPIGMANTTLSFETVQATGNYAYPHSLTVSGQLEQEPLSVERVLIPVAPAGAHWSTVQDMALYLITQLNGGVAPDGARIVSEENLSITWEPQIPISADASYGLGWIVDDYKGLLMIQHGGNTLGFTSDLAFLPGAGLGISVITNGQATNGFNQAVRTRLFELVFEQEAEVDTMVTFAYAEMIRSLETAFGDLVEVAPEQVEPFTGIYFNEALGQVELRLEDDQFVLDAGEFATTVRARIDDMGEVERFYFYGPPLLGFPMQIEESEAGEPQMILGEGAVRYLFTLVE
jgi:CubicO group peptidase (beta-lactamase class C family)